jgi:hypothetical protein
MVRSDEQLRRAMRAPARPEYAEAEGDDERWKQLRRDWAAELGSGSAPPQDSESASVWKKWWKRLGEHHRELVADGERRFGAAQPAKAAPSDPPPALPAAPPAAPSDALPGALPLLPRRPAPLKDEEANARRQEAYEGEKAAALERRAQHAELMAQQQKRQKCESTALATAALEVHKGMACQMLGYRFEGELKRELCLVLGESAPDWTALSAVDLHRLHIKHCMPPPEVWLDWKTYWNVDLSHEDHWPFEWGWWSRADGQRKCSHRRLFLRSAGYDCPELDWPGESSDEWILQSIRLRVACTRQPYPCTARACVCAAVCTATAEHVRDMDELERARAERKGQQEQLSVRERIELHYPDVVGELPEVSASLTPAGRHQPQRSKPAAIRHRLEDVLGLEPDELVTRVKWQLSALPTPYSPARWDRVTTWQLTDITAEHDARLHDAYQTGARSAPPQWPAWFGPGDYGPVGLDDDWICACGTQCTSGMTCSAAAEEVGEAVLEQIRARQRATKVRNLLMDSWIKNPALEECGMELCMALEAEGASLASAVREAEKWLASSSKANKRDV